MTEEKEAAFFLNSGDTLSFEIRDGIIAFAYEAHQQSQYKQTTFWRQSK